jgi:transcriptional regulator with XRE-family HTH domain
VRLQAQKPPLAAYPRELRTLGDHLRRRRLDLGLLQREVAEQLGVDATTVYNWERHRTEPAVRLILQIMRFLDTP